MDLMKRVQQWATNRVPELSWSERSAAMNMPTLTERRKGDTITGFKFLNKTDNVESEKFIKISKKKKGQCEVTVRNQLRYM